VVLVLRSSIYLIPGLLLFALTFKKFSQEPLKKFAVFLFAFSLSYLLFLIIPTKKLDRYILPSLVGFLLVAASSYYLLLQKFKVYVLGLFLIPALLFLAQIHPDYFSYYNPLFGGLRLGVHALEPKWLVGQPQITKYLVDLKEQDDLSDFAPGENFDHMLRSRELQNRLVVGFPEKYYTQIWPFVREIGGWAVIADMTAHAKEADYFVYPVWDDPGVHEDRFKLEFVGTISVRGVELYNVYQRLRD